jgi:hypothetical protein
MATNFTGSDVIAASDVTAYQTDAFDFGIGSGDSEVTTWLTQTTNDILRDLRIKWWPVYKTNVYTDITVLNTAEMSNTKVNLNQFKRAGVYLFLSRFLLPALTKFRSEADKDRFERMIEFYTSAFAKEFQSILDDGVEYDSDAGGTIAVSEKEPLHAYNRLNR